MLNAFCFEIAAMQQIAYLDLRSPLFVDYAAFGAVLLERLAMRAASGISSRTVTRAWGFGGHCYTSAKPQRPVQSDPLFGDNRF